MLSIAHLHTGLQVGIFPRATLDADLESVQLCLGVLSGPELWEENVSRDRKRQEEQERGEFITLVFSGLVFILVAVTLAALCGNYFVNS